MLYRTHPVMQILIALVLVFMINVGCHASLVAQGKGIGWSEALSFAFRTALVSAPLMPVISFSLFRVMVGLGVPRLPGPLVERVIA